MSRVWTQEGSSGWKKASRAPCDAAQHLTTVSYCILQLTVAYK